MLAWLSGQQWVQPLGPIASIPILAHARNLFKFPGASSSQECCQSANTTNTVTPGVDVPCFPRSSAVTAWPAAGAHRTFTELQGFLKTLPSEARTCVASFRQKDLVYFDYYP